MIQEDAGQDKMARAHSKHGHLGILWTGAEDHQEALQARLQYLQDYELIRICDI